MWDAWSFAALLEFGSGARHPQANKNRNQAMSMPVRPIMIAAVIAAFFSSASVAQTPAPDEAAFRALYKELVELNTTRSVGSCTAAAEAMRAHLLAAGIPAADTQILAPPDRPKDGALIAVLHGRDPHAKPILLLAHIDVVEAKREDWERDPFKLVEEHGWFYARGSSDDKAMASVFTDSLIRYQKEDSGRAALSSSHSPAARRLPISSIVSNG
jgi:Peptidase family M20/M25/M40